MFFFCSCRAVVAGCLQDGGLRMTDEILDEGVDEVVDLAEEVIEETP
jgi:hypothetical protein